MEVVQELTKIQTKFSDGEHIARMKTDPESQCESMKILGVKQYFSMFTDKVLTQFSILGYIITL